MPIVSGYDVTSQEHYCVLFLNISNISCELEGEILNYKKFDECQKFS